MGTIRTKTFRAGTAILLAAGALLATPAHADMHIDLSGYSLDYVTFADNDETSTAAPSDHLRNLEFRHDLELHFTGEKTLDNGTAVGLHAEMRYGNESRDGSVNTLQALGLDPNQFDEAYLYYRGGFGEFSIGSRDGAAFLLQVAAPSADPHVDGLRTWVQAWNPDVWDDGLANASLGAPNVTVRLDYDNADFGKTDRIVYLTPALHGFRAGASYAPKNGAVGVDGSFLGMSPDDRTGRFEHILDLSARWDGNIGPVKLAASAIHSGAQTELDAAPGAPGSDNVSTWDLGLNGKWGDWSLGGAYMRSNTGTSGPRSDVEIWVAGAAWDHDKWHVGASYYTFELQANAFSAGLADDIDLTRITGGVGYKLHSGMDLRASLSSLEVDNGTNSAIDPHQLQFALGTEIWF